MGVNSEVERLTAVLRAEANGTDLKISKGADGRIYVCGDYEDGTSRVLGSIDSSMLKEPEVFWMMVDRIKFERREG